MMHTSLAHEGRHVSFGHIAFDQQPWHHLPVQGRAQALGHDIGELASGLHVLSPELPPGDTVAELVGGTQDVLGLLEGDGVVGGCWCYP